MLQFKIGASISDNGTDKIHTGKWNVKSRHEKMGENTENTKRKQNSTNSDELFPIKQFMNSLL